MLHLPMSTWSNFSIWKQNGSVDSPCLSHWEQCLVITEFCAQVAVCFKNKITWYLYSLASWVQTNTYVHTEKAMININFKNKMHVIIPNVDKNDLPLMFYIRKY